MMVRMGIMGRMMVVVLYTRAVRPAILDVRMSVQLMITRPRGLDAFTQPDRRRIRIGREATDGVSKVHLGRVGVWVAEPVGRVESRPVRKVRFDDSILVDCACGDVGR